MTSNDNVPVIGQQTGMVAVSQAREIQEIQAMVLMAHNFRRNQKAAMDNMKVACKIRSVAEEAMYSYPKGGTLITGASIRLAEVMAQNWGNLDFGMRSLEQTDEATLMESYCWDLETNVKQRRIFSVPHTRYSKAKGNEKLIDPRDIYEMSANLGARRLRSCILGCIPKYIQDECVAVCEKSLSEVQGKTADEMAKKVISSFKQVKVTVDDIERRIGHSIKGINQAEVVTLRKIFVSIRDGIAKKEQFFPEPEVEGKPEPGKTTKHATTPEKAAAMSSKKDEKVEEANYRAKLSEWLLREVNVKIQNGMKPGEIKKAIGMTPAALMKMPIEEIEAAIELIRDLDVPESSGSPEIPEKEKKAAKAPKKEKPVEEQAPYPEEQYAGCEPPRGDAAEDVDPGPADIGGETRPKVKAYAVVDKLYKQNGGEIQMLLGELRNKFLTLADDEIINQSVQMAKAGNVQQFRDFVAARRLLKR